MDIKPPPVPFALKTSDKHSDTWARLKKHLQARSEALRNELENDLDERATAKKRGQLAEVRALLALDRDSPPGQ